MNARKDREAHELAQTHFRLERGLRRIFRLRARDETREQADEEPIKLLEVHEGTVEVGIAPVYLGPDAARGLHYPTVIIEISPEEFERLERNELVLPDGWRRGEEFEPPACDAGQQRL